MAEKKGFWASLFGTGGCSCGMSIEEEKEDGKKPAEKKGGCCDMQIIKETPCSCGEAKPPQKESGCDCGTLEEKSNSGCCGGEK